jgi:hypothetical protein
MAQKYFHYTSRQLAQEIVIAGRIRPRSSVGRIYLTQDAYCCGAEAAARLSIVGKPVELCGVIPEDLVLSVLANAGEPQHVEPLIGSDGTDIRPGCGLEYFTQPGAEIEANQRQIHWLDVPVP